MLHLELHVFICNVVTPTPNVILATSVDSGGPIYTFLMGDTQAVQLNVDEPLVQRSIGE